MDGELVSFGVGIFQRSNFGIELRFGSQKRLDSSIGPRSIVLLEKEEVQVNGCEQVELKAGETRPDMRKRAFRFRAILYLHSASNTITVCLVRGCRAHLQREPVLFPEEA